MWTFLARRLLQSIIVLIGVTLISFISLQMGGDPTYLFVSENASTEEIQRAREMLGFDRPLYVQYLSYIWNAMQGDFGNSLSYRQPAIEVVLAVMPATIELTFFSLVLAIGLSIPLGIYAALNRGKPVDGGIMTLAFIYDGSRYRGMCRFLNRCSRVISRQPSTICRARCII
jgi:peptide/nickel transport system permease protein